jgi:hypothetical protein
MRIEKFVTNAVAAAAIALAAACGPESPGSCACTEDFRAVQFLVVVRSGAPVPVDGVVVTQVRTGSALAVPQPGTHAGVVNVVDDSFIHQLEPAGDVLHVVVTTALGTIAVDVTVGVDEPCGCHVLKLAGPDIVGIKLSRARAFDQEGRSRNARRAQ